ncbi:MAG: DUF421 domain-containing protein [Leptolyngbya sp. SIO4C5]|nr:DUF421 domain-containing protein [Leptolyngbya sp. SIO4C5]
MIDSLHSVCSYLLGLEATSLTFWQMALRAAIVYLTALAMMRFIGDRRVISSHAAFDMILGIILGATLSGAITGATPFFGTLIAGSVLVVMHWLAAMLSFRFGPLERLIKGKTRPLIQGGEVIRQNMRRSHISNQDLEAALRSNGALTQPDQVALAHLENNGNISVIPKPAQPQIIEVKAEAGVQTIQIRLE